MDTESVGENPLRDERNMLLSRAKSSSKGAVLATCVSVLGTLSFGYCIGYSSPASYDLKSASNLSIRLSRSQESWFSSSLAVGALFGCIIAGPMVDVLGRKVAIIVGAIPFEIGWFLLICAKNHLMLYSGRIITGLGCGIETLAVAVYITEIAPPHLRGRLGSINILAVTSGQFLAYIAGFLFYWDWLSIIGSFPPALVLLLMVWMPESPRWFLDKNRKSDALKSLLWLRGSHLEIEEECRETEATLEQQRDQRMSWKEFITAPVVKPVLIGVGLLSFQQLDGINAVLFNAADIFSKAGIKEPKLASLPLTGVQLIGNMITLFTLDRIGRRIPLYGGALGMAASLIGLGVYFELYQTFSSITWLSILSSVSYCFFYSLSWGPVPWIVMAEIIPLRARGLGTGISTVACWVTLFLVTETYSTLAGALRNQGVMWFYAGLCFFAYIFVVIFVPETKKRSLEEIESIFRN